MFSKNLFILTLLLLPLWVDGQRTLIVEKPGQVKHFFYHEGDKILFDAGVPSFRVSGRITQLGDSSLTLDNTYRVNTGRISKVYKKRSWWFHSWKTFFVASFAYTAGSVINHAVKSDDLWDNTMLPVSGVLAGGGALSLAMRYRDLEIGEKWRIRIIDLDHPVLP